MSDVPNTVVLPTSWVTPSKIICVCTFIGTQTHRTSSAHSDCVTLEAPAEVRSLASATIYHTNMIITTAHAIQKCSMKLLTVEGEKKERPQLKKKKWAQPEFNVVTSLGLSINKTSISVSQCLFIVFRPNLRWGSHLSYQTTAGTQPRECLGHTVSRPGCGEEGVQTMNPPFLRYRFLCMGEPCTECAVTGGTKQKPLALCFVQPI